MAKHCILHFPPTRMLPRKSTPPQVPLEPDEIVDRVLQAVDWDIQETASLIDIQ